MSGYGISLNSHRHNPSLSDKEKLLLIEIGCLSAEKGYCWASNEYIAERLGVMPRAITRNLGLLNEKGLISLSLDNKSGNNTKRKIYLKGSAFTTNDPTSQMTMEPSHKGPTNNNIYKSLIKEIKGSIGSAGDKSEMIVELNSLLSSLDGEVKKSLTFNLPNENDVGPVGRILLQELKLVEQGEEGGLKLVPRKGIKTLLLNKEYIDTVANKIMEKGIEFGVISKTGAIPDEVIVRIRSELSNMLGWYKSNGNVIRDMSATTDRWFSRYFDNATKKRNG